MRKIEAKNYLILFIMLLGVVIITFAGANFYNNSLKKTSEIYKYASKISRKELKQYLDENSSVIIYISDKYDLTKENEEKYLKDKIVEYNLYNNFIYVDKKEFNEALLKYFNDNYYVRIDMNRMPIIIIYNDDKITNIYYNVDKSSLDNIDFGGVK